MSLNLSPHLPQYNLLALPFHSAKSSTASERLMNKSSSSTPTFIAAKKEPGKLTFALTTPIFYCIPPFAFVSFISFFSKGFFVKEKFRTAGDQYNFPFVFVFYIPFLSLYLYLNFFF
jgi:hypothetical protein